MTFDQLIDKLPDLRLGQVEPVGYLIAIDRLFPPVKEPYSRQQNRQGAEILLVQPGSLAADFPADGSQVLNRVSDFRRQQNNHPGDVHPDHQNRQRRHRSVNRVVTSDTDLKIDITELTQLPAGAAENAADYRRRQADPGIRHEQHQESKRHPHCQVRKCLE